MNYILNLEYISSTIQDQQTTWTNTIGALTLYKKYTFHIGSLIPLKLHAFVNLIIVDDTFAYNIRIKFHVVCLKPRPNLFLSAGDILRNLTKWKNNHTINNWNVNIIDGINATNCFCRGPKFLITHCPLEPDGLVSKFAICAKNNHGWLFDWNAKNTNICF